MLLSSKKIFLLSNIVMGIVMVHHAMLVLQFVFFLYRMYWLLVLIITWWEYLSCVEHSVCMSACMCVCVWYRSMSLYTEPGFRLMLRCHLLMVCHCFLTLSGSIVMYTFCVFIIVIIITVRFVHTLCLIHCVSEESQVWKVTCHCRKARLCRADLSLFWMYQLLQLSQKW